MKIRIKLCQADSGQPLCLVVRALKLPQFEVSILSGVSRHLPPLHLQTLIEYWWGWWDPPFISSLSDHLSFHSLFKKQTHYNFVAQRIVATNLIVSSSKQSNFRSLRCIQRVSWLSPMHWSNTEWGARPPSVQEPTLNKNTRNTDIICIKVCSH